MSRGSKCDCLRKEWRVRGSVVGSYLVKDFREFLDVAFGVFHCATAVEVGGPRWRLRQRLRGAFVEHLGHERDQVADDARVLDEVFNDRIGELRLFEIEVARWFAVVVHSYLFVIPTAAD